MSRKNKHNKTISASPRNYQASDLFGAEGRTWKSNRVNKHNEAWEITKGTTADEELLYGQLENLRYRCRQLNKDNPIAEGTVIAFQEMAIGDAPYLSMHFKEPNIEAEKQIEDVIKKWSKKCDVTGEKTINQLCRNLISGALDNGDVLVNLVINPYKSGVQTVVELIEADRVSTPLGMEDKNVRHGVQYNSYGEVIGYWVRKVGLNERNFTYGFVQHLSLDNYVYMPKYKNGIRTTWLWKRPISIERPGMSRQVPLFNSCIWQLNQIDSLIDAEVVGVRVSSCIMGAIKSSDAEGIAGAMQKDPTTGNNLTDRFGRAYSKLQPGGFIPLRAGESIDMINPNRHNTEVVGLVTKLSKDLAMKTRIPYPMLFLDMAAVNFSSFRAGVLESRKMFRSYRKEVVDNFLEPVFNAVIREAWLMGLIPALKEMPDKNLVPRFGWPAWGFVDPDKEIKAVIHALDNKLTSPQRAHEEQGNDYREVYEEIAIAKQFEQELEIKYGIKMPSGAVFKDNTDNKKDEPTEPEEPEATEEPENE